MSRLFKSSERETKRLYRPGLATKYDVPKKALRWRRIIKPAVFISLLIGLFYLIFGSQIFDVGSIKTVGNKTLTQTELDRQTREIMKATFFGDNWLFLNTSYLADQLKHQNYQIGKIAVRKRLFTNLEIQIDERQPSLGWKSADVIYILSEDGRAFSTIEGSDNRLPFIVDQTNLPVELGAQVVPKNFVNFALEIIAGLKRQGVEIEQASVSESTSELYIKTKKGYVIKFDSGRSAIEQLADLATLLKLVAQQKKPVTEYIDLRIPQKVFYK